ncbi:Kinesin-like calmodulin-binding protein like [Dendrobium catenatum]|uniref:Kinesin-like calmodulin-binding protein like n=1 Tax=Dendrobium catenatum TaxID=906689 RepID=A0A2I0VF33_9ASPA|nr:Kinesin-like calmodulin-binding protein like [Dendrobium catenatum]
MKIYSQLILFVLLKQTIRKLQEDLKIYTNELQASKDTIKSLLKEKLLLEQKIQIFEKKKKDEISMMINNYEDKRQNFALKITEFEQKLVSTAEVLRVAESTIATRNIEIDALHDNLKELQELRDMKEDIDRKNEQTALILKRQGSQLAELEALYKEELVLRKRYYNIIEDMKGKIRVFCRLRPLNEKEIAEKKKNVVFSVDEFTVEHPWKDEKSKQHIYDRVFGQNDSQEDVFADTKYLVQSAVDGYNVCIFAYGQTGSGKTFTIYGSESHPGLTPRATAELFRLVDRDSSKFFFSLKDDVLNDGCLNQDALIRVSVFEWIVQDDLWIVPDIVTKNRAGPEAGSLLQEAKQGVPPPLIAAHMWGPHGRFEEGGLGG